MQKVRWVAALLAITALQVGPLTDRASADATPTRAAEHVAMRDGVRLSVSTYRPTTLKERVPSVLIMTIYGREQRLSEAARNALLKNGVAVIFADMRGTGASFGRRRMIFSAEERRDINDLLNWIQSQPWSDGRIIVSGASYDANLTELAVATENKSIVAAVPRFEDFNTFRDLVAPGGVRNEMLLREWGKLTRILELNEACLLRTEDCQASPSVAIDGDKDFALLRAALLEHQSNWDAAVEARAFAYEDDVATNGQPNAAGYLSSFRPVWTRSRIPAQIWGSWLDARTADSALQRFEATPHAPIELVIGAWSHGGDTNLDPLRTGPANNEVKQGPEILSYIADVLAGSQPRKRRVRYYTMGAGVWRESAVWPPVGLEAKTWSLTSGNGLRLGAAVEPASIDKFDVDFAHTTGTSNRWHTQIGGKPVSYANRQLKDRKVQAYASSPMDNAVEITGSPILHLNLSASRADGAIFVCLEAVSPEGRVVYLTEGQRRIGFRGSDFSHAQFAPPAPGTWLNLQIPLAATSVVVDPGWRLRLSIAGADSDTFGRYPSEGDLTYSFKVGDGGSWLSLPQAAWQPKQ